MKRKILANSGGRTISAYFKDDDEYTEYIRVVSKECLDAVLSDLPLETVIRLWEDINKKNRSIKK